MELSKEYVKIKDPSELISKNNLTDLHNLPEKNGSFCYLMVVTCLQIILSPVNNLVTVSQS